MPEKLHPNVEKVAAVLAEHNVPGEIVVFAEATPTAVTAAAQLGCEVGAIANSLIFDADGEPLLVLTSGAHRVNTGLVAETIGVAKVRRATPDFVRAATGQVIGGVSPSAIRPHQDAGRHLARQVRGGLGRRQPPAHDLPHLLRGTRPHHRRRAGGRGVTPAGPAVARRRRRGGRTAAEAPRPGFVPLPRGNIGLKDRTRTSRTARRVPSPTAGRASPVRSPRAESR
ncbi:YbaK/EbsC family protein [Streptosporangium lutulentum]